MTSSTPARSLRRASRGLLAGAVAVLALAGCMRIDIAMTVASDDTVAASMVLAVADDLAQERFGMDPAEFWGQAGAELTGELPEGATQEPYAEDGFTGARITLPAAPLDEMSGVGAEEIVIVRDGDEFVLTGSMDLADTDVAQLGDMDLDGMLVRVRVTFPGEVTEHNGSLDGTTVTWEPQLGERNEMTARAAAEGSGAAGQAAGEDADGAAAGGGAGRTALIAGLIALVVGGGTALALALRHRRDRQEATTGGATPEYVVPVVDAASAVPDATPATAGDVAGDATGDAAFTDPDQPTQY